MFLNFIKVSIRNALFISPLCRYQNDTFFESVGMYGESALKKVNIETVKATLCKQPDSATLDRIAQEIRKGLATKPSWWKTLKVPTLMAAALVAAGIVHKFHKNQKSKKRTSTQHAALTRSAAPHDAALAAHDVYVEHVAATSK